MSNAMPGSWVTCELRDVLAADFPGSWGSDPGSKPANVIVLRSTNLDDEGHIDYSTGAQRYFTPLDLNRKRLSSGDILLEASGGGPGKPVGRVALFESPDDKTYASSNFFRTLRLRPTVDSRFLSWYLQWTYQQPSIWQFQQQTTGIINLKYKDYLRQQLALPEVWEQRRIADVLDTAAEAIRSTERLIAKLEQARQGLLHDLLSCGIDQRGHLREASELIDSPSGKRPSDWERVRLRDVAEVTSGSTPSRRIDGFWKSGTVPWVKTSEISFSRICDTSEKITHSALVSTGMKIYPVDTVLVAMYGEGVTRGRVATLGIAAATNQACAAISGNRTKLIQRFLFHYLRANYGGLRGLGHGSQQTNLSGALLEQFPILLPDRDEQERISDLLDHLDKRSGDEEMTLVKLWLLKQGLMDDLLTGRVQVGASG